MLSPLGLKWPLGLDMGWKKTGFHTVTASCLLGLVSFPLWSLEKYEAGTVVLQVTTWPFSFLEAKFGSIQIHVLLSDGTYCEVWILSLILPSKHRYNWLEITWNSWPKYIHYIDSFMECLFTKGYWAWKPSSYQHFWTKTSWKHHDMQLQTAHPKKHMLF